MKHMDATDRAKLSIFIVFSIVADNERYGLHREQSRSIITAPELAKEIRRVAPQR